MVERKNYKEKFQSFYKFVESELKKFDSLWLLPDNDSI